MFVGGKTKPIMLWFKAITVHSGNLGCEPGCSRRPAGSAALAEGGLQNPRPLEPGLFPFEACALFSWTLRGLVLKGPEAFVRSKTVDSRWGSLPVFASDVQVTSTEQTDRRHAPLEEIAVL